MKGWCPNCQGPGHNGICSPVLSVTIPKDQRAGITKIYNFDERDWHAVWKMSRSGYSIEQLCAWLVDKDKFTQELIKDRDELEQQVRDLKRELEANK